MLQIAIDRSAIAAFRRRLRRTGILIVAAATTFALAGCASGPAPQHAPLAINNADQRAAVVVLSPTASLFPLDAYDQNVDYWIPPEDAATSKALLTEARQQHALDDLRDRYFGGTNDGSGSRARIDDTGNATLNHSVSDTSATTASPWNRAFIERQNTGVNRQRMLAGIAWNLQRFGPSGPQQGFGPNLRPYPAAWINTISSNIDTSRWTADPAYTADRRAITTGNVSLRMLPTDDPHFYDPRLPGEGYPFDNLQETELRPGTPLYIVGSTLNQGWLYVIAPDVSGWVKDDAIGRVDETFVAHWRAAASVGLGAVIAARLSISDVQGVYRFEAPIGTILPLVPLSLGAAPAHVDADRVWIPILDMQRRAVMGQAVVTENQVTRMPYRATPAHMAVLLKALQGRPYGWGGTGGYNDCSLELKSLFTPFGIWLPRHSSAQVEGTAMVDLSDQPFQARIDYLTRYGKPFLTIIDIRGHVMLYLGNRDVNGRSVPIVYEDMWGLTPSDASRRAIIGQSVIFPLLSRFPEDDGLQSQAARRVFRLGFPADQIDANDAGVGPLPPEDK